MTGFPDSLKKYVAANKITIRDSAYISYLAKDGIIQCPLYYGANWTSNWSINAMERYYLMSGDENAMDYLIGYSQYADKMMIRRCDLVPYGGPTLNFPEKGKYLFGTFQEWDANHDTCKFSFSTVNNSLPSHNGWYTRAFVSVISRGYRYSGMDYLKEGAYRLWNRGSKMGYWATKFSMEENNVATFAYHIPPKDDGLLQVNHLFYETMHHTDSVPPEAVTDLSVFRSSSDSGLVFNWTAPAGVASYQLKYFKNKRIVDYLDYLVGSRDDNNRMVHADTTKVPWWFALNATNEPLPGKAGDMENFLLRGNFPLTEIWYAALCSRDSAGNLSALSNVVTIDDKIGIESWQGDINVLSLSVFPNPFNPSINLRVRIPKVNKNASLSIYNTAGQLIWKATFSATEKHSQNIIWSGKNRLGQLAPSGIYFVNLSIEGKKMIRKIMMTK
jgi:hypothetical protein